jgi:hypothetical protein
MPRMSLPAPARTFCRLAVLTAVLFTLAACDEFSGPFSMSGPVTPNSAAPTERGEGSDY